MRLSDALHGPAQGRVRKKAFFPLGPGRRFFVQMVSYVSLDFVFRETMNQYYFQIIQQNKNVCPLMHHAHTQYIIQ